MKEIFQEYGGILITVMAIIAAILIIKAVIGSDEHGAIGSAFSDLITEFIEEANENASMNAGLSTE